MRRSWRLGAAAGALALAGLCAGCDHGPADTDESAAEAARQALGTQEKEHEVTTEERRDLVVEETTKVIDRNTGNVISTEKDVTPVTVSKEKEVDTDVDVDVGETTKTIE